MLSLFFINILYTKYVKKISDLIGSAFVSFGFFIRLVLGSVVADVDLKIWLIALLFLSSFFISILKNIQMQKINQYSCIKLLFLLHFYSYQLICFIFLPM